MRYTYSKAKDELEDSTDFKEGLRCSIKKWKQKDWSAYSKDEICGLCIVALNIDDTIDLFEHDIPREYICKNIIGNRMVVCPFNVTNKCNNIRNRTPSKMLEYFKQKKFLKAMNTCQAIINDAIIRLNRSQVRG